MTKYTPTTDDVRSAYMESRKATCAIRGETSENEFDRWLAAHDQGIRDAAKPPAMTAREHLEAAWEGAHEVHENQVIPAHTPLLSRDLGDGSATIYLPAGFPTARIQTSSSGFEYRTLEPLPPLIPDDCMTVWASSDKDPLRSVWIRDARLVDAWVTVTVIGEVMRAHTNDLIDPKPVPEEER